MVVWDMRVFSSLFSINVSSSVSLLIVNWVLVCLLVGCEDKQTVEMRLREAHTYLDQGQLDAAVQSLRDLSYDPTDASQVLDLLAVAYFENGQLYLSAQTFEQAFHADLNDCFQEDALHAARGYEQINNLQAAARCYRLYLDVFEKDASAWFALSRVEAKLDHPRAALLTFLRGLECSKSPIEGEQMVALGQLCLKDGKNESGLYWYEEALKCRPDDKALCLTILHEAYRQKNNLALYRMLNYIDEHFAGMDVPMDPLLDECRQMMALEVKPAEPLPELKETFNQWRARCYVQAALEAPAHLPKIYLDQPSTKE